MSPDVQCRDFPQVRAAPADALSSDWSERASGNGKANTFLRKTEVQEEMEEVVAEEIEEEGAGGLSGAQAR
jgi:hypothetical protein